MKRARRGWLDPLGSGWCYLFVAPMLVVYLAFILWPTVASWYFAFFRWDGIGWPTDFVGLRNFRSVAADPLFWNAFKNSWIFTAGILFVQVPLAFLMATLLNNPKLRGRTAYRTLLFLPVVTTSAVVGIVLSVMLSPAGGPVNHLLRSLGLVERPLNFFGSAGLALPTIVVIGIWKTFGINLVYWLAGLQSIPRELYEAARIDGANGLQVTRFVTLPMLRPIALAICVLALSSSLNVFDLVKVTTNGGPFFASDVVGTYVYRSAFGEDTLPRFGFASAAGVFFGLTSVVIVFLQLGATRLGQRGRG